MKVIKFVIIVLFITFLTSLKSQNINISFAARYYGHPIGLDSILVKNINRNCDTVIVHPDTVLSIAYTVSVYENYFDENPFSIFQNYPNPISNGRTSIEVQLPNEGWLLLNLFDFNGINISKLRIYLSYGMHKFDIKLYKSGPYILTALYNGKLQSNKLLNKNNCGYSSNSITYNSKIDKHITGYKSQSNTYNSFWFEPGDTLWYVAFSKISQEIFGSDIIESAPQNDTLIRFNIIEGIPCKNNEAVKYAGHLYPTVQIDNQCWLKENLKVGNMIVGDSNMRDNGIIEKYCYNNDLDNCEEYGSLYQWGELMKYTNKERTKGICPIGWHIPSYEDWDSLIQNKSADDLKESGTYHWLPGNNSDNSSGFTALPGGYRRYDGFSFEMINESNGYFTSTEDEINEQFAWDKTMYYSSSWILGGQKWKSTGKSVRCIKD